MPDSQALATVRDQAAQELGRHPREVSSDFYSVGEVNDGSRRRRELIVVTAALDGLQLMAVDLIEGGLRPTALDTEYGALARSLSSGESAEPCFIIDLRGGAPVIIVAEASVPKLIYTAGAGINNQKCYQNESTPFIADGANSPNAILELAREVGMCAHYLEERQDAPLIVKYGYLVGAGRNEGEIVKGLTDAGIIEFRRVIEHHDHLVRHWMEQIAVLGETDKWLIPLGLSMYGQEVGRGSS